MNAQYVHACCNSKTVHHRSTHLSIFSGSIENGADEAFSRGAQHQRTIKGLKVLEVANHAEVVGNGFAKPDSGVDDDLIAGHPMLHSKLNPLFQEGDNLGKKRVVVWTNLHGPRRALHMHQDQRRTAGCG